MKTHAEDFEMSGLSYHNLTRAKLVWLSQKEEGKKCPNFVLEESNISVL